MMKQNKISDSVSVNDNLGVSPIGIVRLYDNDGNLILETHNMVVKSGREIIFKLFKHFVCGIDDTTDYNGEILVNFSYTSKGVKTVSELTLSDIETDSTNSISASPSITIDDTNLNIKFKVSVAGNNTFMKFNQIYLTYVKKDDTESNKTLFSRVAIDPVFIGSNGNYDLEYTLYF